LGAQPEFEIPDLPRDLTELDDRRLMTLFSEYVSWQNFAATKFSESEIEENRAEAALRYVEASAMVAAPPAKGSVTAAKAQSAMTQPVQDARDRVLDAYALRKMTQVVYTNCERCVNLISRELTRRVGRDGPERRSNRWTP